MIPPAYSETDLALPVPAPLTFRYEQFAANTDFGWHCHPWGQLNRISLGLLSLQLPERTLLAPADYLVWVPADVLHAAHIREALDYVSVYVAPALAAVLPATPCLIPQTPLLRALLDDFCLRRVQTMDDEADALQARLLVHRLQAAGQVDNFLPDSDDRLLQPVLATLRANPGDATPLGAWARQVHTTERTLARRFERQLGMGFAEWRSRVRLMRALARLKEGGRVQEIAGELGYATASAFIAMFSRHTGMTPERYRRQLHEGDSQASSQPGKGLAAAGLSRG